MALVALQFEDNQILVAAARASAKRLQVSHLFSVELNGNDSLAADLLRSRLSKFGLSRCDAIIVISRADAEMRELVIPPAPDNEIPDMVRFVARNEFASLNENWALDYLPISGDATQSRHVLAVGISPELQHQVKTIATNAGLKVKHIVLRPFASIDLIRSQLSDNQCRLLVDPNGDQTDMTIVDGDSVVATRTVRNPESNDANRRADSMLSEVRRTLASSRKMLGGRSISEVVMFGDAGSNKSLEGNIRSQFEIGMDFVQPLSLAPLASGFETPTQPERYAAVLGSLLQHNSGRPHLIDFVNPRRPVVKKNDYSKWYLWGGLALAASLMAVLAGWFVLNSQAREIARFDKQLQNLRSLNGGDNSTQSAESILGEIEKIDEWKAGDVNWLEEMSEYSKRSLTPDDSIVDSFDAVSSLRADSLPRLTVNVRITEVAKELELIDQLGTRPYRIKPPKGVVDPEDSTYPLSSTLNISLERDPRELIIKNDERAMEFLDSLNAPTEKGANDKNATENEAESPAG